MKNDCKKCLLYEAGEAVAYEQIMAYAATLDKSELVSEDIYEKRISECKKCDNLISGMCLKCGCYVEIRARLASSACPDYDNRHWSDVLCKE